MPAPHPEVSILIVSYNTRELLRGCLSSLQRVQDETDFEIIVVDNASQDASPDMIASEFPSVKLIQSPENIGFASGVNLARQTAVGDFLFVLNPDCLVPRFTIQKLRSFVLEHTNCAVAGAHITTADGHDLPSVFIIPTLFREFWNFLPELKSRILHWIPLRTASAARRPHQVESVSGAGFMTRAAHFDAVGGMDSSFFLYHEELDLCVRLKKAGFEVWTLPDAQVIHYDAQASGYSTARLARGKLLEWRVLGMDRLWQKHRTPEQHKKWRRLACRLLKLRIGLLRIAQIFSNSDRKTAICSRIQELKALSLKIKP